MLLELHTHTSRHSSCSIIDPVTLVKRVIRKGLQGIIITEHHYLWPQEELAQLRRDAEADDHFLILSGQEVDTDIGHVVVYGADKSITEKIRLAELRRQFPDAALVWAHPFRHGREHSSEELLNSKLDGIEIFSLNQNMQENFRGLMAWHNLRFTAVSGSDTHSESMAGVFPTQFDHSIKNINEAVTEIKKGRCRPFFKEIPRSGATAQVTEITIGTKGDDELRQRIIVRHVPDDKKWDRAIESAKIMEKLSSNGLKGSAFRVPKILEINEKEKLVIEEGQRGKNLFDVLLRVRPDTGKSYVKLAAQWLAKLHNLAIRDKNTAALMEKERKRFKDYEQAFARTRNPHLEDACKLVSFVGAHEETLFREAQDSFVMLHGDYHPKNIFIGQDLLHDPGTVFVSVIDFGNSIFFDPAFDVGYFLSQFQNQFGGYPEILERYDEDLFVKAYLETRGAREDGFDRLVRMFKIRANLSIAAYLIKVGKGESKEMEQLISRSLALLALTDK